MSRFLPPLDRSVPLTIVGGPQHGGRVYLSPAILALPEPGLIHVPRYSLGDDGKVQVIGFIAYSVEPELARCIYQVEARGQ